MLCKQVLRECDITCGSGARKVLYSSVSEFYTEES